MIVVVDVNYALLIICDVTFHACLTVVRKGVVGINCWLIVVQLLVVVTP